MSLHYIYRRHAIVLYIVAIIVLYVSLYYVLDTCYYCMQDAYHYNVYRSNLCVVIIFSNFAHNLCNNYLCSIIK